MSLAIGKEPKSSGFGRIEDGTYPARLVQVIDLGVQELTDYKTGEVKGTANRVYLCWEFPTETIEVKGEIKPRWQGKEYTISYHEKAALPGVIKALDPKGEAKYLSDLLGKPCMVGIGSTSGGNAKITGVFQLAKGMPVDELQNPARAFDFSDPDVEVFKLLPEFLQDKIKGAVNFEGSRLEELLKENSESGVQYDEESPFDE